LEDMKMTDAVRNLMAMNSEVVSAKYIAPVLKMSESVIVKYAKDGTWDADRLGNYVISGGHVKFFRKDFLQKCGFLEPDPEEPTDHQLIIAIVDVLETLLKTQKMMLEQIDQQNDLLHAMIPGYALRFNEKTAGAGTPTE